MARRKIVAPFGRCRSAQTGEQDPEDVCRDFAAGNLRHFSRLPEAYTLRARAGAWVREAVGSRDIDVRRVERRHCQPPPPADDESIDAPHADSAWPTTSSPDRPPRDAPLGPVFDSRKVDHRAGARLSAVSPARVARGRRRRGRRGRAAARPPSPRRPRCLSRGVFASRRSGAPIGAAPEEDERGLGLSTHGKEGGEIGIRGH